MGAAAAHPDLPGPHVTAAGCRVIGRGGRLDGCRQRRGHRIGLWGGRHLVVGTPAKPDMVAIHRMVDSLPGAGQHVVDRGLTHLRQDQPQVPRLHRILRRYHAMDVADRGAAWNRQLDAVRGPDRHRRVLAGHPVGDGHRHHDARRGRHGRAGDAGHARPRAAGRRASDRLGAADRRVYRCARITYCPTDSILPGRRRHPTAQCAQAGAADPAAVDPRPGACVVADTATCQCARAAMALGAGTAGTQSRRRLCDCAPGSARRQHVTGLDRPPGTPRRLRCHPRILERYGALAGRS
ncbi:Uncharacterised protein [Mycobacteroides abscessus subsp. abscessus]|nr:Uncharacterised protein [Mycobacteroides abscessus subsp. abscessus]